MNGNGDAYSEQQAFEKAEMEDFEDDIADANRIDNSDAVEHDVSSCVNNENQVEDVHMEQTARNENVTVTDTITYNESRDDMRNANLDNITLNDNANIEDIEMDETPQDDRIISRHERYRLLSEHNRLWRMHRFRPRRKKHVETQSLASRSLHYNGNTDSYSAVPLKSIDPKDAICVNDKSLTLIEYCLQKDWENARLRAMSHPHEADPPRPLSSRQFSNRFCQQAYKGEPESNSANEPITGNNNSIYSFRYDPMLSYSEVSTQTTALSYACNHKAPIETIKAITKASPRQLRYTKRANSIYGTPLHEAIGIIGDKSDWKVIQFLVQSDEEYDTIAKREMQDWQHLNLANENMLQNSRIEDFHKIDDTFSEAKNSARVASGHVSSPRIAFGYQKETLYDRTNTEKLAAPFHFVQEQAYPYFSQKSTKRRDSLGRTALHRWIDRVLGIYQVRSAFASLDSETEQHLEPNLEDINNLNTNDNYNAESTDELNKNCFNEIQKVKDDSEEIFEITRILVNAYPEASALADRSGKTPLAIALQWESIVLIRYQLERRRRILGHLVHGRQTPPSSSNPNTTYDSEVDLNHNIHTQRLIKQMEQRILGIVRIMVEAYPYAIQIKCSSFGCTPLHHAIMHKRNFETIRVLLETSPESTMIASNVGELPLHTAASMAAPFKLLKLILDAGPKAASKEDRGGRTPLHWIWIRYIIAASAKSTPTSANAYNDDASSNNIPQSGVKMNILPQNIGHILAKHRRTVPVEWSKMQEAWCSSLKDHIREKMFRQKMINSSFWKTIEIFLHAVYTSNKRNLCAAIGEIDQSNKDAKSNFMVVHAATAASCPRSLLRLALVLYPDAVRKRDEELRLPIHIAASRPTSTLWKLDEREVSVMEILLKVSPETAEIVDSEFRLPIHLAIDSEKRSSSLKRPKGRYFLGRPIHGNVRTLLSFSPHCLSTMDGKRHGMLCPFMLAGCGESSNLNLCFDLLRQAPESVHNVMNHSNCSDIRSSSFFDPVQKKQRLP